MIIGIPKERKEEEYRVGLTDTAVEVLVQDGHRVLVERAAGEGSGIGNDQYRQAGASIVDSPETLFSEADIIVKVKEPLLSECRWFREGHILISFLHLAPNPGLTETLLEKKVTGIGYETIQARDGSLPLLIPMSEIAGRLSVQIGATFLQKQQGGKGLLLSGVPGVRNGHVAILGSGVVGGNAARIAVGLGARVTILGQDLRQLRVLQERYGGRVTTRAAHRQVVDDVLQSADVAIGAVHVVGSKTPLLVTKDMVSRMTPGSVVVDVSVDQGGCFETSRPTTHRQPVFDVNGVLHYGVANMPGIVPQTSTQALTNAALPIIRTVARLGLDEALRSDPSIASGLNLRDGRVYCRGVADALGLQVHEP